MPTIDEQLAALAATWDERRRPITVDEATERSYVVLDAPRVPMARRPRLVLAVAAVLVLLVGAGAWVVARRDGDGRPAAGDDSPWWIPTMVPDGWKLNQALAPAPVGPLAFGSAVSGERAIFVTVGVDPASGDFSDPVEIDGHRGTIASLPFGRLSLVIDLDGPVEIRSVGVTEDELLTVARSYRPEVAWADFPLTLPDGFPPVRRPTASTAQFSYMASIQYIATVSINPDPAAELARLATLAGPLRPWGRLRSDVPLVGRGAEWQLRGGRTVVMRPVGPAGVITVEMGDDGALTAEAVAVAEAMAPTTQAGFDAVAATASGQLSDLRPATCGEEPTSIDPKRFATIDVAPGRSIDLTVVPVARNFLGAPGGVVCAFSRDGGIGRVSLPTDIPAAVVPMDGALVHALVGVAPSDAMTVRVESPDGTRRSAPVVLVPGTTVGVWALPWETGIDVRTVPPVPADQVRAFEFLDAAGDVLARIGRPAR